MLVMVAVILRLRQRVGRASPLARRMLLPVLAAAIARAGLLAVGVLARAIDPRADVVEALSWALAFAFPVVALVFLAGVLRWRLFAGRALHGLASGVRTAGDAAALRRAFARTFDDPSIELAFPVSGGDGWMDCEGRPFRMPDPAGGRSVTEVRNDERLVAAIVHDPTLDADPALLEAGTAMAAVALDNQRLVAEADAAMREVRQSRARIAASALDERRRIERDLHDGAQQRLVALRIELELAEDLVRSDPERGAARLGELEDALDDALEELRSLAHGVYPPLLADLGLVQALRAAGKRSAIPVEIEVHDVARAAPQVESAVYFCLIEALQNVQKHARGASRVAVDLDGRGGDLRFSVRDDGAGVADGAIRAGVGITNMRDRLAALGGEVAITSTPRLGTLVRGRVPWVAPGGGPAPASG
jgi:signal transduction histidine kinase